MNMNNKSLVRLRNDRMIFGVAAGLANYLSIDPVLVRLLFVLLTLAGGHGLLIYLVLALVMPDETAPAPKANAFDEEEIIIKQA
jgi:phage shock protein C